MALTALKAKYFGQHSAAYNEKKLSKSMFLFEGLVSRNLKLF